MAVAQKPLGIPIPKTPKVERLVIRLRLIFFRWLDTKERRFQDEASERVPIVYSRICDGLGRSGQSAI